MKITAEVRKFAGDVLSIAQTRVNGMQYRNASNRRMERYHQVPIHHRSQVSVTIRDYFDTYIVIYIHNGS